MIVLRGAMLHLFRRNEMDKSKLEECRHKLAERIPRSFRSDLSDLELWVLDNRILAPRPASLRKAGKETHVSYEWIRKIEMSLAKRLRRYLLHNKVITTRGTML